MKTAFKSTLLAILLFLGLLNTGFSQSHVWYLYRSEGAQSPACSSSPSSLAIPFTENFTPGIVIKANNGLCYTIAYDGYQMSEPTIDYIEEYSACSECSDGGYVDPCTNVSANWVDLGEYRCNGNAREKFQIDLNSNCTKNAPRWAVDDPNGCNPCNGVGPNWQDSGVTRCNGNAREMQQVDQNANCTQNTEPRWVVIDPNGCNPCNGVVANWQDNGVTRCNGNASEKQQADQNAGCTGNVPRWVVADANGCNPYGSVAFWQDNGQTRCNGNASEKQQVDLNTGFTGNAPRWVVVDPNGCNPCNGVTANWQDNGVTRCNGNASEKQQSDQNAGCTGNVPRWIIVDPNGCNPCNGVVANWQNNGLTRCNGNASEKQQEDLNSSCTGNIPRWVEVDPNGCAPYHVWNLYRSQGADNPACSTSPSSLTIPYNSNFTPGIIIKASNGFCYTIGVEGYQTSAPTIDYIEEFSVCSECKEGLAPIDPCLGVVANWQDNGVTRCNGDAREKQQVDQNANCTKNEPRWVVVDPLGCHNPCDGVVANWQDNGQTRCNGNASEKQQNDLNFLCTLNTEPRWVVVDPNGCAPYHVWNLYRSQGADNPACSTSPSSLTIPYNSNFTPGIIIKASNGFCYTIAVEGYQTSAPTIDYIEEFSVCSECKEGLAPVDPCLGVVSNWQDNGVTRCNGDASEKQQIDQNTGCTKNEPRWVVVDPMGCHNPCLNVVADWRDNGVIRCNGNASEKQQNDLNFLCTLNTEPRWVVVDPNGCNPYGVEAFWQDNGVTRCNGNASEKQQADLNSGITGNVPRWVVVDPNGCNPCNGVVANWQDNGVTRCNGNASEKQQVDQNTNCTKNAPRWVVVDPNGCNPYGVEAFWQDNGVTRCNGNASEKQQVDQNTNCTKNAPRWLVVDSNGCNPYGVEAFWQDNGVTRCNGNASEKQQADLNSGITGNVPRWVVIYPNGCNPCNGVVANWQDNGVTRCNGNASEKQQVDQNTNCTKNELRWVVVDPNGCNPCNGVVANWQDNGVTRCNGNASEKQQVDQNTNCTKNEPRWVVVDPNVCNPCYGVIASWIRTSEKRCSSIGTEEQEMDSNANCTGNYTPRWVLTIPLPTTGNLTAGSNSICKGTSTSISINGQSGTIQWQEKIDGYWYNLTQEHNTVLKTPALYQSKTYRALLSSGVCFNNKSTEITIEVNPVSKPIISASLTSIDNGGSTILNASVIKGETITWSDFQAGNQISVSPSITTTYSAYATNAIGCKSDTSAIVVKVLPAPPVITGKYKILDGSIVENSNIKVCKGEMIQLEAIKGCSTGSIEWSIVDSSIIHKTDVVAIDSVKYIARCKTTEGYSRASNEVIVTPKSLDLNVEDIVVYPNPTYGLLRLKSSSCLEGLWVQIYSVTGAVLYHNYNSNRIGDELVYDFTELPWEQYFIHLSNDKDQHVWIRVMRGL